MTDNGLPNYLKPNSPVTVLSIFGTRPEVIKMAPVVKQLAHHGSFVSQVCVTGQHQEMLKPFLDLFAIEPDYCLDVMQSGQTLAALTAKILQGLDEIFQHKKPDIVLVHGDTTTTFAASLAAFYHHIPVAHVEAGLRTRNIFLPFPEEANRHLTGVLAQFHFAPTSASRDHLLREGVPAEQIYVTGNTVIDALFDVLKQFEGNPLLAAQMAKQFSYLNPARRFILVTGHRRESFGEGFQRICNALADIATKFPEVDIVYPVHLNPAVQKPVKSLLNKQSNIYLIDPVTYLPFVYLMRHAFIILTDSGGIQEEAPSLGKPVLVMRDKTERPEAVEAGTVRLVGTNPTTIVAEVRRLIEDQGHYQTMSQALNPYGDGEAAKRIVYFLSKYFRLISYNQKDFVDNVHEYSND